MLSTVRHIADADYRLLLVSDGCADLDVEVHRMLIEKGTRQPSDGAVEWRPARCTSMALHVGVSKGPEASDCLGFLRAETERKQANAIIDNAGFCV
jgi:hypothetical protein